MEYLKLTEELAADIKARVKTLDFKTLQKLRKAKDENGTFDVIISTEDIDRSGEIVRQDGWEMANYKNNPIILWGHDYYSLPIGVCTDTYKTEVHGVPATGARGVFYPADINPLAQQVRRMYEYGIKSGLGVGCTTSVGFIPKDFETDNRNVITKAELLEFSFVPIPANQGVGPAQGRQLTFDEAKELGLDVAELRTKGLEFVEAEKKEEEPEQKAAQAGDDCTMDDGSPGVLGTDDDNGGNLVCQPIADKSVETKPLQKKLLKAVGEEHDRHAGEIEKAIEDFKSAIPEDQNDPADANEEKLAKATKAGSEKMGAALKDFRASVSDEHTMHRANSLKCFRSFEPSEDKAFDKNEYLKALRDQHDAHETKCMKAIDDLETRCMKSVQGEPGESDEHTDWITGKMEEAHRVHRKAVVKIAKSMCKAAFGEEDQADEKTIEILKEFLTPHIDASLLPAVISKVGAKLSAATKAKLGEAHEHLKAATAVVEALHGGLGDSEGEESRSDGDEKSAPTMAPERKRSRPAGDASAKEELDAHLLARDVLRGVTTAASTALERLKNEQRNKK
jgi:hypothetical protein